LRGIPAASTKDSHQAPASGHVVFGWALINHCYILIELSAFFLLRLFKKRHFLTKIIFLLYENQNSCV
jgi:hypothetical protein